MNKNIVDERQENKIGEVALKMHPARQYYFGESRTATGREYVFVVRANISLAWVAADDEERILNTAVGSCCGGKKKYPFRLANESDVRRWSNGGGR